MQTVAVMQATVLPQETLLFPKQHLPLNQQTMQQHLKAQALAHINPQTQRHHLRHSGGKNKEKHFSIYYLCK